MTGIRRVPVVMTTMAFVGVGLGVCHGQATTVVTPGLSVGYAYDDNVLWRPAAESDRVLRVSPTLTFTRDTLRSRWAGDFLLDTERFSRARSLTTALARQHAAITGERRVSAASSVELNAAYDNSVTPTDLNVTTGLGLGRTRAWRWYAGPAASQAITSRTLVRASYRLTGDYAATTSDVLTHDAGAGVEFAKTPRTTLLARYNAQYFAFESAPAVLSHVGRVTWRRRATPSTRVELTGGARVTEREWRPEIGGRAARTTTVSDASVDYSWTQTTALGIAGLVDVQRVTASAGYHPRGGWSAAVNAGAYVNEVGDDRATVYHTGADVVRRIAGPLSMGLSYSFDYQTDPLGAPTFLLTTSTGMMPLPAAFAPRLGGPLHRHFVLFRLLASGSKRSASGPREPAKDGEREPMNRRPDAE